MNPIKATAIVKLKTIKLPKGAVGHKVTTKVPTIKSDQMIADARIMLSENLSEYETINYFYVVSNKNKLVGVFSIKEVLKNMPDVPVKEIMIKDVAKVHPSTDQEIAAHLALKSSIKAIPVVDSKNAFFGVLPSDQVMAILDQESREDLLRISGIIIKEGKYDDVLKISFTRAYAHRFPWILLGLVGGLVTAQSITRFGGVLSKNIILASFIPLLAYIANAVATQTQTLLIRDLATNTKLPFFRYLRKQFVISGLIGLSCWLIIFLLITLIWKTSFIGFVVGFSMFAAIITATLLALLIPRMLTRFDLDPAIGSGPFTTMLQDFLSILIYFSIASVFL